MNTTTFRASVLAAILITTLGGSALAATAAPLAGASVINASALTNNGTYDRFIVTYRAGTSPRASHDAAVQSVSSAIARAGLNRAAPASTIGVHSNPVSAIYQRKLAMGADLVRTSRKLGRSDALALMQQIAADPNVAHVEPDVLMHAIRDVQAPAALAATAFTPNDQYYAPYQWHLRAGDGTAEKIGGDTSSYPNKGGADVAKAWDLADGTGVTVAVIDTGLTHHPDIDTSLGDAGYDFTSIALISGRATDGRVAGGWDTGDWTTGDEYLASNGGCTDPNDPNAPLPEASSWHGTHVSGTIAELTNNSTGMAGSAFNAKVLPVRALGHCGGFTSDIADAIEWASGGTVDGVPANENPAQIISMSLGGDGACSASDVTGIAVGDAISRGVTVVAAAGNSGADTVNFSPASCPGVIAVGSIGISAKRAFYSNYGSTVAIAAPGGGIYANDASSGTQVQAGFVWSAINDGATTVDESGYTYGGYAGTSQATPHVSGTIALVISAVKAAGLPTLSPADIRTLLTSTARAFPNAPDQPLGAGIVDAYAAVNQAIGGDNGGGPGDGGDNATALTNGVAVTGVSGSAGDQVLYKLDVPAGARSLVLRTFGGTGDVSLYVKSGAAPTTDSFDSKSVHVGNSESVVSAKPATATYYVLVVGAGNFANVNVQGTYAGP
ncbi:MAG TPA: S8 family serine peptidase [Luteibacter sp.]|nr:S8 family serine peptidase [Luteibacter sp.]